MRRVKIIFLAFLMLCLGAVLQKNHILNLVKQMFQGYPVYSPTPQKTILNWDYQKASNIKPQYSLLDLSSQEIDRSRPVYLERLSEILGMSKFPHGFPSQTKLVERVELEKVLREKILIETEPHLWVPFYLFIPKEKPEKHPLILVLHGHGTGKSGAAGLIVGSIQKGNALALAENGFVTAAPDLRGFGELGWSTERVNSRAHRKAKSVHTQDVINNLQRGRTLLGSYLYDLKKILSYLEKRPEIDNQRIGIAGTSMGADVAIWFAIFENRIKTVVSSHPESLSYPLEPGDYGAFHACIHTLPGVLESFRLQEIPMLIFPRPILIDYTRSKKSQVQNRIEEIYKESGRSDQISMTVHQRGEDFYMSKASTWFKRWL